MCGRYRLSRHAEVLAFYYAEYEGLDWEARFNIAPTQNVPVIRQDSSSPTRRASMMRWGLVPHWANDSTMGARMINARAETVAEKPAFQESLEQRRCLVPADGFYEWQRNGKSKQPYCFEVGEREPFAFAGLWDRWRAPDETSVETFAILTTTANSLLAYVHDRMPVILSPEDYDLWLDPGFRKVAAIKELLKPFEVERMRRYPLSDRVNSVTNDDPACSQPAEPAIPAQAELF